ncbi:hypothetical protein HK102_013917 [Quaeritorhiza haematococci]|nr:hypothetical protein HK102_013917 [Quaeritorhiza haematococci]
MRKHLDSINDRFAKTAVGRYFKLHGSGAVNERTNTRLLTEVRAGFTTFVAMAYIISVNAIILADSGGNCGCKTAPEECLANPEYQKCLTEIKRDLITATSASAAFACIIMGAFANLPLALAPGLGLNAYFAYQVVGFQGSGNVSYETALAAVFIEGIIFVVLSIFGLRQLLAKAIPMSIKVATGAGIGLFLTHIGLQSNAGIGLISNEPTTLVTLGGCPPEYKDEHGTCLGHGMESATTWIGIIGFILICILVLLRVRGAVLIGILSISFVSWFRNTKVTYFPNTPQGDDMFSYFSRIVEVPRIRRTAFALDFNFNTSEVWVALITFLYVDILDTTGTLFSMAKVRSKTSVSQCLSSHTVFHTNLTIPFERIPYQPQFGGFMDSKGDFEGSFAAFIMDATSITFGALLGSSPNTTFVESGAGIAEGGRTGLTAITTGFFFLLSLFFAPIFASFPPWGTGPALVFIGVMMVRDAMGEINWKYLGDAVPAFLTMALMPLTYSIAHGLIAGIGAYVLINGTIWVLIKFFGHERLQIEAYHFKEKQPKVSKEDMVPVWMAKFLPQKDATGTARSSIHELEEGHHEHEKGEVMK